MSIIEVITPFCRAVRKTVDALTSQDFAGYRHTLASKYGPLALDRHIINIRAMFRWAERNSVIPKLPAWGDSFDKPSQAQKRKGRQKRNTQYGKPLFTIEEIHKLLNKADPTMKAFIYLGINAGLGNTDISTMTASAIDLDKGTLDYPRTKNGLERRSILWPETVAAIKEAIANRPEPADPKYKQLLFLTKEGLPWVRCQLSDRGDKGKPHLVRRDLLTYYCYHLLRKAEIATEENPRKGLNFYGLRRTYRTIADETRDLHAIFRTMGHELPGMSAVYVQSISDDRLRKVADYVRQQVLGITPEPPAN